MFSRSLLPIFCLATAISAHMELSTPVPYGKSTLNNSPLAADGSDFPCKQRTGVYDAEGASNSMALGSKQPLAFIGGATHGGGSCQISITYDTAPTKNSVFKVIHSIEGGCPIQGVAGNNGASATDVDPSTYSFTVPSNLPTGSATLAWTWFNKVGNREMYMNCAPITITGSSSKRELVGRNVTQLMERDQAAFNALPNMFLANIGNGCNTISSTDLIFPNPGESVEQLGLATSSALASATGNCGSAAAPTGSAAPASQSTSAAPVASNSPAATGSAGVFITVASSSTPQATSAAPVVASNTPVASNPTSIASSSTPASTGTSTGTTGSGSAFTAGTACSTEGEWNCVGGTSFQQCASGTWSVVQQLAAGTKCTAGESTAIDIAAISKRSMRFSGAHIRRHLQNSHLA